MRVGTVFGLRAGALAAILLISGCASAATVSDNWQPGPDLSYEQALHKCRKLQPGRLNQRLNLPSNSLRVSACLRERGWLPNGSRPPPTDAPGT
jgi:hypothetical protein